MLKLILFVIMAVSLCSSCMNYSRYYLYAAPKGTIYQGEKNGLLVTLKDIKHPRRYHHAAKGQLIIDCQANNKIDTISIALSTQHQPHRYGFEALSVNLSGLIFREDSMIVLSAHRKMDLASFLCSDTIISPSWKITLKRILPTK
jgi:hypothetical protein